MTTSDELTGSATASGARVAVMSRSQGKVDATVDRLSALGAEAMGGSADVRNFAATEAVLAACRFLASPLASYVSGVVLAADGGWALGGTAAMGTIGQPLLDAVSGTSR
jgi:hypothetical protein